MGFNFGAFAGGLAKGGVDTYVRLSEEERRDAEAKRQVELHNLRMKEEAENEQLKSAFGETLGRAGTPESFRTAGGERGPVQQLGLPTAPIDPNQPAVSPEETAKMFPAQKMYSQDQAMQDYRNKVMGINPIKGAEVVSKMQGLRKGDLELGVLERSAKQDAAFDAYMTETHQKLAGMRQNIQTTFDTDGMSGLVKKYGSEFSSATGYSVSLVGNALVTKDKEGKVVGQPITRPEEAINTLSEVLGKRAMESSLDGMLSKGLFKNSAEMMDYFTKRSTMRTQESTAAAVTSNAAIQAAEFKEKLRVGLFSAEAGLKSAQTNQANAHAGVYSNMVKLANENREAGEAMKPFLKEFGEMSAEDQMGAKGQAKLLEAGAAAAKKTGDINGLVNILKKPDKSQAPEIDPKLKEAAYKEYSEAGTDPKALAAVKAKYPGVFGPSALDKALAGNKPADAAPAVEGRPFYNKTNEELMRMTKRAIGTSTAEAREAQAELDARKGEPRMKAF